MVIGKKYLNVLEPIRMQVSVKKDSMNLAKDKKLGTGLKNKMLSLLNSRQIIKMIGNE